MARLALLIVAYLCLAGLGLLAGATVHLAAAAESQEPLAVDLARLPANQWVLIDREDDSGGKRFARAVMAENVDRLYLWGIGGRQPARNVYQRYELESFDLGDPFWQAAFPAAMRGKWTADDYPPFRIYGQSGPDGLKHDEGPRLQCVGGYHATNRVQWWDFDGVSRPSPIHTFNMACWDSKRQRVVFYSDGCTFALNPATNSWTNLEAKNYPTTCRTVTWASMAYDSARDQVLLFGGGLATNPTGAAPTWLYDCAGNVWRRPKLDVEPPPRCNAPIVFDPTSGLMVMFGGYNQAAAMNDTWVYDGRSGQWEDRRSKIAPPPMFAPAAALAPGGKVLVCGNDARKVKLHHLARSSADKETWLYDITANTWTPLDSPLTLEGYDWLSADASARRGVVLMVAFGPERRTYAFRCDPAAQAADRPGAPPGTIAWKYPEQKLSLEQAPPPDVAAQATFIEKLPANTFVDAQPPGMLISKTWSTAVIDTDRSEVIYTGGGHSGYSGNDVARYNIAENRWTLDMPPSFPPYLESTNAGIFGWSYGMVPFSQHTYLWYGYDPASKTVVYLARPALVDGVDVQLTDDPKDTFVYDAKKHGYASWVYDSAEKKMRRPSFGRTFANPWHLSLAGTPRSMYAVCNETLYHGTVDRRSGKVQWKLVDENYPKPGREIKYHYEFQPLLYDSRRERLIQLKGDESRVDVFVRPLANDGRWQQIETIGTAAIGREAVYIPKHDVVLWLDNKRLFSFDCASNRLGQVEVELPDGLYTHECAMVYDAKHDVCVALVPRSFSGPMQTFLYRHAPTGELK